MGGGVRMMRIEIHTIAPTPKNDTLMESLDTEDGSEHVLISVEPFLGAPQVILVTPPEMNFFVF